MAAEAARMTRIACAIYTRKSSDEGLEKEFNSLDAQREACEAFVTSQKHVGWVAVRDLYNDGGLSGGTMERPALKRLLADIKSGQVQIVVVYKVDRLTRSLSDFAKIVDVLDAHGASFVSVTQQFNTTTSMGRLTLNMLLSFAQFEREIAGERIRDKIAASKAKGMWMGGTVPLGYDVKDRKLVINEAEAETVRMIFRRYAELGSVTLLQEELDRRGIRSKRREGAGGRLAGDRPFSRGILYLILQNHLYRGEVEHKGNVYPGQHESIVDTDLWRVVQDKLAANRKARSLGIGAKASCLLSGVIFDSDGNLNELAGCAASLARTRLCDKCQITANFRDFWGLETAPRCHISTCSRQVRSTWLSCRPKFIRELWRDLQGICTSEHGGQRFRTGRRLRLIARGSRRHRAVRHFNPPTLRGRPLAG